MLLQPNLHPTNPLDYHQHSLIINILVLHFNQYYYHLVYPPPTLYLLLRQSITSTIYCFDKYLPRITKQAACESTGGKAPVNGLPSIRQAARKSTGGKAPDGLPSLRLVNW
jgi:hypothetical protein